MVKLHIECCRLCPACHTSWDIGMQPLSPDGVCSALSVTFAAVFGCGQLFANIGEAV